MGFLDLPTDFPRLPMDSGRDTVASKPGPAGLVNTRLMILYIHLMSVA